MRWASGGLCLPRLAAILMCPPPTELLVVAQVSRSTTTLRFMTTIVLPGAHRPAPLTSRARRARTVWKHFPFLPFSLLATAPGVSGAQLLSCSPGRAGSPMQEGSPLELEMLHGRRLLGSKSCQPGRPHGHKHATAGSARIGRMARSVGRALVHGGAPHVGRVLQVVLATCWRVSLECSWGAGGWGRVQQGHPET